MFTACVTDPPYGLEFMGKEWDKLAWTKANGHTRLSNVPITATAKLWSGWGTALKPAWEPIIVARKPLDGTMIHNCLTHGCGALNIDGCRITGVSGNGVWGTSNKACQDGRTFNRSPRGADYRSAAHLQGRWPANLIHDGSEEVVSVFPSEAGASGKNGHSTAAMYSGHSRNAFGDYGPKSVSNHGDSGSAARFFYCAKASRRERGKLNSHPTVKPLSLMRYLLTLVTQPEVNRILDPFCGSGTTLLACRQLGLSAVGIDSDPGSIRIARRRLKA
jgi:site-specific DNA-methyltransferase (adenine-specific)